MSQIKQLIHEIHRRSLWQVLGIYLAASWVAMQVVETLTNNVGLPDWVPPFAVILLVIGFPVVMATAFVQEGVGGRDPHPDRRPDPDPSRPAQASVEQPTEPPAPVVPSTRGRGHFWLFTWRNALLGGVAAFALLGVAATAYMVMRTAGIGPVGSLVASGVLAERAPIVVSEFEAADPSLAQAVTEAFRVDLSQSRIVTVVEPSEVRDVLARMERDPEQTLDVDVAVEVAIREGYPAIIAGEINPAGAQTVISARLVAAGNGEVLASYRETAADSTQIVPAVDRLSKRFRERIGESLKTIRSEPPLASVTTSSLDALRKYSQAHRIAAVEGDIERAIALLQEAVAIDPGFASAWRFMGSSYGNTGHRARMVDAYTRAFENRDRLTERERYATLAAYYENVTVERDRAINAYRNLLELDPDDHVALNNLGNNYEYLREFARAEELFRRALDQDSSHWVPYWNVAGVQVAQGNLQEAWSTLDALARLQPGNPVIARGRANLAAVERDYAEVEDQLQTMRSTTTGSLGGRAYTSSGLAAVDMVHGRLREAAAHNADAFAANMERDNRALALGDVLFGAWADLIIRKDTTGAIRRVEDAVERHALDDVPVQDWGYLDLADFYAAAGEPARARQLLAEYEAELADLQQGTRDDDLYTVRGTIALAEGRYQDAVAEYRQADVGYCLICAAGNLAYTFDRAGQADSAIVYYEKYLTTPWFYWRLWFDGTGLGVTYERLGQLYDERGDMERAAGYYARFVDLWDTADPELQPRVEVARRRLEQIAAERG